MIKYTSCYDRVFTCLHNSSLRLNRDFFLIPLRWRIRQILLYLLQCSTFASERHQVRTWGRQTCFLPQAPSNLVTPLLPTLLQWQPFASILPWCWRLPQFQLRFVPAIWRPRQRLFEKAQTMTRIETKKFINLQLKPDILFKAWNNLPGPSPSMLFHTESLLQNLFIVSTKVV